MDLHESPADRAFRTRGRAWLAEHPSGPLATFAERRAWHRTLYEAGFLGLTWPAEHGGHGASPSWEVIVAEELADAGAPGFVNGPGLSHIGPTLIAHGSEEQKRLLLPRIAGGDDTWTTLYSEPGAGSDLAALQTRAIRDGALQTRLTSIDPQPRATLDGLRIERIAERVQDATIPTLASGDILFIDSSHIVSPGSDVDHLIGRIVPTLPAGALVHIHDIFLPDPYPAAWDYRRYNEQDVVGALLESGTSQLLFASRYVSTRMADDMARTCLAKIPLLDGAFESSLWLMRR